MSISTSSTRSNSSIKPLRGKENYITWSIEIENILLHNNNVAYIRNSLRAACLRTRYLDEYYCKLKQYDCDLEAYNAAVVKYEAAAKEAAGCCGRPLVRPALPKKPEEATAEEKELKI